MSLKPYFFTEKSQPDLLKDYDVIGFDVEHCLVKFKVDTLCRHIVKGLNEELNELGYPAMEFEFSKHWGLFSNNATWDIEHGTILKLDENKKIMHAVRGYQKLSLEETKAIYGPDLKYEALKWPQSNKQVEKEAGAH